MEVEIVEKVIDKEEFYDLYEKIKDYMESSAYQKIKKKYKHLPEADKTQVLELSLKRVLLSEYASDLQQSISRFLK